MIFVGKKTQAKKNFKWLKNSCSMEMCSQ